MFFVNDGNIGITKGDTATLRVDLVQQDGEPYEMATGDTLTFTVRPHPKGDVIFSETSTNNIIQLNSDKTGLLPVGYLSYDVELETSDGKHFTVIGVTDRQIKNITVFPNITE